jgi:hypothetical protein
LAPTGTAAALLLGSTYHSFLGVPIDGQTAFNNETTNNAPVKTRLDGVEYIFLDEVSMVACNDNYKISSQLAKALNEFDWGSLRPQYIPGDADCTNAPQTTWLT